MTDHQIARSKESSVMTVSTNTTTADAVHDQHLVSQVVLKRFTRPVKGQPKVYRVNLEHLYAPPKPTGVRKAAYEVDFIEHDSRGIEDIWAEVENRLGPAIQACIDSPGTLTTEHTDALKDAIALHFVRSLHLKDAAQDAWTEAAQNQRTNAMRNPNRLIPVFRDRYGFEPAGTEAISALLDDIVNKANEMQDVQFRHSIEDLFNRARSHAAGLGLEVCIPTGQDLVISDSPAVAIGPNGAIGIRHGVGFTGAHTVILPITPTRAIGYGPNNKVVTANTEITKRLNRLQLHSARKYLYCSTIQTAQQMQTQAKKIITEFLELTGLAD